MNIKTELDRRLEILGWTIYKVAKHLAQIRAADGDPSPALRYHTTIGKAMENPAKSRLETIEDIVEAMNGELKIEWHPCRKPEEKQSTPRFEIRFISQNAISGLTYESDFTSAFNLALDYHNPSGQTGAEIWLGNQCLCSVSEIFLACQKHECKQTEQKTEHSSGGGYVVITEVPTYLHK